MGRVRTALALLCARLHRSGPSCCWTLSHILRPQLAQRSAQAEMGGPRFGAGPLQLVYGLAPRSSRLNGDGKLRGPDRLACPQPWPSRAFYRAEDRAGRRCCPWRVRVPAAPAAGRGVKLKTGARFFRRELGPRYLPGADAGEPATQALGVVRPPVLPPRTGGARRFFSRPSVAGIRFLAFLLGRVFPA